MRRLPTRLLRRGAVVLAATTTVAGGAGLASAQDSTTVSTALGDSSRQLALTDLAGLDLDDLALVPGAPAPFRVNVTDSGILPTDSFTVEGTLNNLYQVSAGEADGYNFATFIPSDEVTLDFVPNPLGAVDPTLLLSPDWLLNAPTDVTCGLVASLLGSTEATLATLTDPLCGLTGAITGTAGVAVDDIPLDGFAIPDVALDGLGLDALPIALSVDLLDSGTFTTPDCANGIGAGDSGCTATSPTSLTMLGGQGLPLAALPGALADLLAGVLPSGDIVPDISTATAVIATLRSDANAGVADIGAALAEYAPGDQATLINGLFTVITAGFDVDDILATAGTHTSVPRLTVNPTTSNPGAYAGTLTATLVE